MPFTSPPTAPNIADPATFATRASEFVGYIASDLVPELTAATLAWGPGTPYCAVGGPVNARTLTSGLSIAALVTGQQVRFRAPSLNTGSTTLNLDGLGARPCVTVTGAALPAGFIRSDADTVATYDGANWVVSRAPQTGTWDGGNGVWMRAESGEARLWHNLDETATAWTTAAGSFFTRAAAFSYVWPFALTSPVVAVPAVRRTVSTAIFGAHLLNLDGTGADVLPWSSVSTGASLSKTIVLNVQARWY